MSLPEAEVSVIVSLKSKAAEDEITSAINQIKNRLSKLGDRTNITNVQDNLEQGLEKARLEMNAELRKIQQGSPEALEELLTEIKNEAVELTPRDTGRLRESARVDMEQLKTVVRGQISFDTPYAAIVHEVMDVHHPVGQAKYLQEAIQRRSGTLAQSIADKLKASGK